MDTPDSSDHQHTRPGEAWEAQLLTGVSIAPVDASPTHGEAREANLVVNDVVARLAALTVRRQCNQHACTLPSTGACEHEDARRDADYLRHVLDVLGLPQSFDEVTEDDRANLLTALAQKQTIGVDHYAEVVED